MGANTSNLKDQHRMLEYRLTIHQSQCKARFHHETQHLVAEKTQTENISLLQMLILYKSGKHTESITSALPSPLSPFPGVYLPFKAGFA